MLLSLKSKYMEASVTDQPKTAQGWAWDYIRHRLRTLTELSGLSENLPKVFTFADLKEGDFFIRFPWAVIKNSELVFKNTELYRKIRPVRYMDGPMGYYSAMMVTTGSLHEIPDNEPVIVVR